MNKECIRCGQTLWNANEYVKHCSSCNSMENAFHSKMSEMERHLDELLNEAGEKRRQVDLKDQESWKDFHQQLVKAKIDILTLRELRKHLKARPTETRMPTFTYTVDDETQTTASHKLTANQILQNAGFDTAKFYLVRLEGDHQVSYKDKGGEEIEMHEHLKFITVKLGSTPLSRWR